MVRALVIGSAASLVAFAAGAPLIAVLRRLRLGKAISDEGPESHLTKAGTPTMGGLLMLGTIVAVTVPANLVGRLSILLPLGVMGLVGAIGVADDLLTLQGRARTGGHERIGFLAKEMVFIATGLIAGLVLYYSLDERTARVPHFGTYEMNAAYVVIAVVVLVLTTSASAVTDGLDGLLAGVMGFAYAAYGVIAGVQGQVYLATFCFTVV